MQKIEIVFKIIEISLVALGLVLVVFGWIVPYRQSKTIDDRRRKNEQELEIIRWKKEFIDRQISELYGPIYALILESDIQFSRILYQLGRRVVFKDGQDFDNLPEREQKIWKHYVDTYKIDSQLRMVEIFRKNIHLVYKSEIPTEYKYFLDYSLGWELLSNQSSSGVHNYYGYHYLYNYPIGFNRYVKKTLDILQKEQAALLHLENKKYPSTAF